MKLIKYKIMCEINTGTDDFPNIGKEIQEVSLGPMLDSAFESNYASAKREAYNGNIIVEDIPDPERELTVDERVSILEEQLAQSDEALIELYEMFGG